VPPDDPETDNADTEQRKNSLKGDKKNLHTFFSVIALRDQAKKHARGKPLSSFHNAGSVAKLGALAVPAHAANNTSPLMFDDPAAVRAGSF